MSDADPSVSWCLLEVVAAARGRAGKAALPGLLARVEDDNKRFSIQIVTALHDLGDHALTPLLAILADTKRPSHKRAKAVTALAAWLDEPRAAAALRLAFHDKERDVRTSALLAVGNRGEAARGWVPEIARYMRDDDPEVATWAVCALGGVARATDGALPTLLDGLTIPKLRCAVLSQLGAVGNARPKSLRGNPAVLAELLKILSARENHPEVSLASGIIGGSYGPAGKEAVPLLLATLRDPKRAGKEVRVHVIKALGKMGSASRAAVPVLLTIVEAKTDAIETPKAAIEILGQFGPAAKAALPSLLSVIKTEKLYIGLGYPALAAIRSIDPGAGPEATRIWEKMKMRFPQGLPKYH